MDLQEAYNAKGYFNIAGDRDNELPGAVRFSQDKGILVELMGQFDSSKEKTEQEIVHGFTADGKKLTLLKPFTSSRSGAMPGFFQSEITAQYLLVGDHFTPDAGLLFESIRFTCIDLNHWLDMYGFEKPFYENDRNEVTIKYKKPANRIYAMNADFELHIEFDYYGPLEWFLPGEKVTIRQVAYCKIVATKSKQPYIKLIELYHQLLAFLSIGYFGHPIIKECVLQKLVNNEEKLSGNEIDVLYQSGINQAEYTKHRDRRDFLFRFSDVEDCIAVMLTKWFALIEKASECINILTELFMYRTSPVELRFLSLAQAFESYHRKITAKDANLQSRLEGIIDWLPADVKKALIDNEKQFILDIKRNRNYFTHYDEKLSKKAARLGDLYLIAEKMKIILITIILKELSLTDKQLTSIILSKGMRLFNHLLKQPRHEEAH